MLKKLEATEPNSCWNKAKDDEMVFVLLARDAAAPAAIRAWVRQRIALMKNCPGDAQIRDAIRCAAEMEKLQGVVTEHTTEGAD